jgi:Protein of unknown function (DUF2752)
MRPPSATLTPNERKGRLLALAVLPAALLFLRSVPPAWLPLPTCGAITGLPCIFCGTTRALQFLLNGDFQRALYFNWLAFPLVTLLAMLVGVMLTELLLGSNFLARLPKIHFTKRTLGGCFAGLLLLWGLQVYLAVSQHKHELLNPNGPLYSLVAK